MPQLALAASTLTTAGTTAAVTTATTAAASAAATATLTSTLMSVATNVLTNLAISAALSALQPQVGVAGRTFEWTLDPDGPIPFAAGRVGVAGSVVYRKTYGPDLMYYGFVSVLSGAGPIDGFETFRGDDEFVTFDGAGKAITSQWKGEMWLKQSFGTQPDTALVSPAGLKNNVTLPGWTGANRLSGKAAYMLVLGENSKRTAYPTGEPKPLYVIRGLKGWDPRQDSTYPGGAGPCRLNDPSTWVYIANPILWALKWSLGLWEGPIGKGAPQVDYQVGGIGAKLSGIDVPAFVAAANVADANGWTVAAYPTTDDDKSQVLDAFLQAGGAIYAQRAGKISCIQRAAPRASIVTISAADTAGPLEIDTAASRIDRINTIRPRYWSEAHRWQLTALDEVTAESYQVEDGGKRTRGIDYPYVTDAKQAAQLAALQIANTREGIAGVIPLKPHLQRIRPGDAFTITEPGFVLNGLKCLCLNTDYDPATGVVRVSFVSETDQKYPFALGQSPVPPAPPTLTPSDPTVVSPPGPNDWVITPRPPGTGGTRLPGFNLSGVVGNSTATAIEVQWWEVPDGVDPMDEPPEDAKWQSAGTWPPTATDIPINVPGGRYYWIGLIHVRNLNYSERTVYGPYLAGVLVADMAPDAPALEDIRAEARAKAALLIKEAAARWNRAETDKRFVIQNIEFVSEKLAITRETLELADADQIALLEVERVARIDGDEAESIARQLQIAGVEDALSVVDEFSRATATALGTETETRTSQVSSLGDALAIVDDKATTAVTTASAAAEQTTALVAEVGDVKSAVTINAEAIADLEAQNNIARFDLEVAAGGGKPARVSLISQASGSDIALLAEQIWFGDNTFWADGSDTFQTLTAGGRRLVTHGPFGVGGEMLMWLGPSSIAVSSMSRANADFFIAVNAPRIGGADFPVGGGSSGSATGRRESLSNSFNTGNTWATVEVLTPSGVPAAPFISANVEWLSAPSVSDTGTWVGELRLIEVASETVVGGPEPISITHYNEPPGLTLTGPGSATGAVQYALQCRRTSGSNNVSSIAFAINFDAYQRL
ncbi:hypothetical protein [Brevundimonas sp.]|uniref:hypothetical protein n=1 Tax=Brevundimonas sp. TaxID=1871086 RepID=UPI002EDA5AFD